MSIVTLKKKTQAKYNNMSVGSKDGFSLNGTHRNQGYVGQTMLSRSLPRTLAKGNTLRGNGGCCGSFPIGNSVISAVISTEDPNVVKSSVLNTDGMISTHYRWIRRPAPYATVKPNNNNNTSQGSYIHNLQTQTIKDVNSCDSSVNKDITNCNSKCSFNKTTNFSFKSASYNMTKPESSYVAKSYGEYLIGLDKKCQVNNQNIANNNQGTPFACTQ
jgi:hypothetical protein